MDGVIISPLALEVLLFHYYSPAKYENMNMNEKAVNMGIADLVRMELLQKTKREGAEREFDLSERGEFYVASILCMPLPVRRWEIPR